MTQNKQSNKHFSMKKKDIFREIDVDINSLDKILYQILYYEEYNVDKFVLNCCIEKINLPVKKAMHKLRILKLIHEIKRSNITIAFRGLPKCIFEKYILTPRLKWYFEKNIIFLNDKKICKCEAIKPEACRGCFMYDSCCGISKKYTEQYGTREFQPLYTNKSLYDLNLKQINQFTLNKFKTKALMILDDFKDDSSYNTKTIFFSKEYPVYQKGELKEQLLYRIYNNNKTFSQTYDFIQTLLEQDLESLKYFLSMSSEFMIDFSYNKETKELEKTLLFAVNDLSKTDLESLSKLTNLDFKFKNIFRIGMSFSGNEIHSFASYNYKALTSLQIKNLFHDIPIKNKKTLLKFANSLTQRIRNTTFIKKYNKNQLYSKGFSVSLECNNTPIKQLRILFNIKTNFYEDKTINCFNIDVFQEQEENIITIYYSLKKMSKEETLKIENKNNYSRFSENCFI